MFTAASGQIAPVDLASLLALRTIDPELYILILDCIKEIEAGCQIRASAVSRFTSLLDAGC